MEPLTTKELRRGNYVIDKLGNIEIISSISGESNIKTNQSFWKDLSLIDPISLSKEWLERFDLVPHYEASDELEIRKRFYRDDFTVIFDLNDECAQVFLKGETLNYIYYVHELQNIYFDLTNFELSIKEKGL